MAPPYTEAAFDVKLLFKIEGNKTQERNNAPPSAAQLPLNQDSVILILEGKTAL